jgi:hypothetical protein
LCQEAQEGAKASAGIQKVFRRGGRTPRRDAKGKGPRRRRRRGCDFTDESRKAVLQYATRTGFADYLQSLGDVPKAANARAAAMHNHACKHSKAQQTEHMLAQVF